MPEARPAEESAPSGPGFLRDVLFPFALSRILLAGTAWFGAQMSPSWSYPFPEAAGRGFAFVPWRALDAFGRWDSHWYLDVASGGYALRGPLGSVQSNVAFFPLYPWLVRGVALALRPALGGAGSLYPAALLVSNACALAALALLVRLALRLTGSAPAASRAALYLVAFPAGFVLSCAYPESLFLALAVGSFLLADQGRFGWAGALGFLAALSRPGGVLVAVAIAWMALDPPLPGGRPSVRRAAFALLPVAGLAVHAANLWRVTGDPLALFLAQAAWGRSLAAPWTTALAPRAFHPYLGPLEAAAVLGSAALSLWLVPRRRTRALGVLGLASLLPVALSGTLASSVRFAAVLFPSFVALGALARSQAADRAVLFAFSFGQALLFLFWTRFFWVG